MSAALLAFGVLLILQRAWAHLLVVRFFRRPPRELVHEPELVSILQPILSGDPRLAECLERNLLAPAGVPSEFLWLLDADDVAARNICDELVRRHPERTVHVVLLPPPPDGSSPKTCKLIAGVDRARGDVLCVLDDDTVLPAGGLRAAVAHLEEERAGLAFGLPYYTSFENVWSSLVSCFVNRNALTTYVPYTFLMEPFTINGMFFVFRRSTHDALGGFRGLESFVADDFAIARRFRSAGLRLVQTPLRHAIATHVTGPRAWVRLLHRWFVFPRETVLKGLRWRELLVVYLITLLPALGTAILLLGLALTRSRELAALVALSLLHDQALFAHLNRAYLGGATPWRRSWLVLVAGLLAPFQILYSLLARQRIHWRGHVMDVDRGGTFRFVRRRAGAPASGSCSERAGRSRERP